MALNPIRSISVQSILHGSEEAKAEGEVEIQQHSRIVGRGKYVHGFEIHTVKPEAAEKYKKAAEQYYAAIKDDSELHVKLTGSWETVVGRQDTFVHILEYENFGGYDKSTKLIANSKHAKAYRELLPHLTSRELQLCQEFAFLPSSPPREAGGIFELRTYTLKPGTLLQWEHTWRKGIDARRQFVEPVGAWFSQVGRLNHVHHLWQYRSLQDRKETREKAWKLGEWAETVSKTSQMAKFMEANVLVPLPYSPLR
ncbi:NIPSNAP-domain-containing protein [Punctularia strigosozonata HHB-11173 SS5]|uniref:NIPSNAP-domain-containing protein n=1 Tax=Punctularia strigosozonata (strain HHB-11173) TaxID=741275 RepID=UPI0004417D35|nr:NIPSNAP-domain-containing protein [Punctularia strigosozonata HHB-11173 SS5]EIN13886.1 NIPSNAP-domain-containing protein [Punctularia strigosozonata HHB-11173 SS5]